MLCLKLGREFKVWDWWNFKRRHNPYEWALQVAGYIADPCGEERADVRNALTAVATLAKSGMCSASQPELEKLYQTLTNYLKADKTDEAELSPAELVKRLNTRG